MMGRLILAGMLLLAPACIVPPPPSGLPPELVPAELDPEPEPALELELTPQLATHSVSPENCDEPERLGQRPGDV